MEICVFLALAIYHIADAIIRFFVPLKYRPKKNISGDIVLITGGGGGLGRLLAERFSRRGCTIVVWDINKEGEYNCSLSDFAFSLLSFSLNAFSK